MCDAVIVRQLTDGIHLVFHQSNQRRDHYGRAFANQRRQLIAERLAAASRHEDKGVLPIKQVTDDGFLVSLEGIEAEVMLQVFCQVNFGHLGGLKNEATYKDTAFCPNHQAFLIKKCMNEGIKE